MKKETKENKIKQPKEKKVKQPKEKKEINKFVKEKKEISSFFQFAVFFVSILFLETFFPLILGNSLSLQLFVHIVVFDVIVSSILTLISNITGGKITIIITSIILFILTVLFSTQGIFYRIFKVYFSLYNLGLSDQLNSFMKETILLILGDILIIFIFLTPFIIYLLLNKKITIKKNDWIHDLVYIALILIATPSLYLKVESTKNKTQDLYDLFYNINNISLNIKRMGVLNSYYLDAKRYLLGFCPREIKNVSLDNKTKKVVQYSNNVLDLNFKETGNDAINSINSYISSDTPTSQNQYTGMWEGYNIVYITAESFSEIGISEELTPTLYKLTHTGFQFKNFYTPNILSTIGGEFQSLTGLYPDYSILTTWREGNNYFPFGLGTTFQNLGYSVNAYHNNWYAFQDRDVYFRSQGLNNYLGCYNGLENRMNCELWPESDDDMIEVTVNDYIHNESPFLAYYMTVSGHFAYDFDNNYMALKNQELVQNLDATEAAKAYVATQIELDMALERLINELSNAGKLDNTVIVLMADHYPYELDYDSINSLSNYYRDEVEVNHNALIMWNSKLDPLIINKPCMSTDVIPTLYNLFGIKYDSRLYTGKDILSDSTGIAIMSDYSWVTEKGTYYSGSNTFVPKEEVSEDYVSTVNQYINSRLNISKLIMETDYYRYLFSE